MLNVVKYLKSFVPLSVNTTMRVRGAALLKATTRPWNKSCNNFRIYDIGLVLHFHLCQCFASISLKTILYSSLPVSFSLWNRGHHQTTRTSSLQLRDQTPEETWYQQPGAAKKTSWSVNLDIRGVQHHLHVLLDVRTVVVEGDQGIPGRQLLTLSQSIIHEHSIRDFFSSEYIGELSKKYPDFHSQLFVIFFGVCKNTGVFGPKRML